MEGRPRHCPHLGLKHTKAIRFSSPTLEHRCYIFGEPLPIQVDQQTYCLGPGYVNCPRYVGQEPPPAASTPVRPARAAAPRRPSRLAGFWQQLTTRDRVLYLSLVGLLVAILSTYAVIAFVLNDRGGGGSATPTEVPNTPVADISPTAVAVVNTALPTAAPTSPPTPPPATTVPASVSPSATPQPTASPAPTATETSPPTATNTPVPPTHTPVAIVPTATSAPSTMWSTLYFLDASGTYYVPVNREGPYSVQVARRAIEEMIIGPRAGSGLRRTIPAGMQMNTIYIEGGTLYLDFDHSFEALGAGRTEAMAVVLAMTEFSTVSRVQFLVNGSPVGLPGSSDAGPVSRPPYVNFENPYGLEPQDSLAVGLYFATPDGQQLFPLARRIPTDVGTARRTIEEMILGPSAAFQGIAISPLPSGTAIRSIAREGDTIVVDFSAAFLEAPNRDLAVRSLRLAMTGLTPDAPQGVDSVRILVEGAGLETYWGDAYGGSLRRPILNPE